MSIGRFNRWERLDGTNVGTIVQVANFQTGAVATTTSLIPSDNTIPQITEGAEWMTLAFTPRAATNKLKITIVYSWSNTTAGNTQTCALFQDAGANALAAMQFSVVSAGYMHSMTFTHYMTAGTVSATTFRVRGGLNSASTTTFNGTGGAGLMGGVMASSITIEEIQV